MLRHAFTYKLMTIVQLDSEQAGSNSIPTLVLRELQKQKVILIINSLNDS